MVQVHALLPPCTPVSYHPAAASCTVPVADRAGRLLTQPSVDATLQAAQAKAVSTTTLASAHLNGNSTKHRLAWCACQCCPRTYTCRPSIGSRRQPIQTLCKLSETHLVELVQARQAAQFRPLRKLLQAHSTAQALSGSSAWQATMGHGLCGQGLDGVAGGTLAVLNSLIQAAQQLVVICRQE